jgi:hypothetical protein
MNFKEEGDWIVSTPVYIGSTDDVWKARSCPHSEYMTLVKKIDEGMLLVHEKCKDCVAARVKYRPATAEEINEKA